MIVELAYLQKQIKDFDNSPKQWSHKFLPGLAVGAGVFNSVTESGFIGVVYDPVKIWWLTYTFYDIRVNKC